MSSSERKSSLLPKPSPRGIVRGAFLVFFVYLCVRLWLFALWATGAGTLHVSRPEAVAGLIPIGAFMSFFLWLKTGIFDAVVPAGIVIIIGALALSIALKRGFCGWICPVGTVWEAAAGLGRFVRRRISGAPKWMGRKLPVPRWLDMALRGVRYAVSVMLLFWLAAVPAAEAIGFQKLQYYAAADVKILSYFVHMPLWYFGFGATVAVGSLLFGNVWCRYMCPLGGLYGAAGCASACTVVRDAEKCIDCGMCAKACHADVAVDTARSVRAPECDGCADCVLACPKRGALTVRVFGRFQLPWWALPTLAVAVWFGIYGVALLTGHWHSALPESYFVQAVRSLGL
jgi:polyferredoxin